MKEVAVYHELDFGRKAEEVEMVAIEVATLAGSNEGTFNPDCYARGE